MKIPVVAIGNSKGLRLPASVLKKMGSPAFFELVEESEGLRLRPAQAVRAHWSEAFKQGEALNLPGETTQEPWY
ncbi:MAG: hypothetical protein ACO3DK_06375 [Bacteroidia bacterium]